MNCSEALPIQNGQIISNPSFTTYLCKEGYKLIGARVRHCNESGDWLDNEPRCASKYSMCYANCLFQLSQSAVVLSELPIVIIIKYNSNWP